MHGLDEQAPVLRMRAHHIVLSKEAAVRVEDQHADTLPLGIAPLAEQGVGSSGRVPDELIDGALGTVDGDAALRKAELLDLAAECAAKCLRDRLECVKLLLQFAHA